MKQMWKLQLCVLLGLATLCGCGGAAKSTNAKRDLMAIVLQYHQYVSTESSPPATLQDLAGYQDPNSGLPMNKASSERSTSALQSGNYVVIWAVDVTKTLAKNGSLILAYHKDVPTDGGYVGFADGSVKLLTARQFESTAKSKP